MLRSLSKHDYVAGVAMLAWVTAIVVLAGCDPMAGRRGSRSGTVVISDVAGTNDYTLTSGYTGKTGGDWPLFLSLHVHGQIDGTALVYVGSSPTTRLSGRVDWRYGQDWYATNCILHYIPESVRKGHLTVDYIIH